MRTIKITLFGKPQYAKDSEKIIFNKYTKKDLVCHSATYTGWRNSILKQLRNKYKFSLEYPDIECIFYLKKYEKKERLTSYVHELLSCLKETKVLNDKTSVLFSCRRKSCEDADYERVDVIIQS